MPKSSKIIDNEKIRKIRLSKGITATFVSRKLGYKSVSSYTRIELGQMHIRLEKGKQIADILSVDLKEFFFDN